MTVAKTIMRALVKQFVMASIIAALAVGTIAAVDAPRLTSLQPSTKILGIDELPNGGTPAQVMATRWGEFEQRRPSTIDSVEFLLARADRETPVLDARERP